MNEIPSINVDHAFNPEARHAQEDFDAYLASRPFKDENGQTHNPENGQFAGSNGQYFDAQREQAAAEIGEQYTSYEDYQEMDMPSLARLIGRAEIEGDKTLENDLTDILLDKMIAFAESNKLSAESQDNLLNRLNRVTNEAVEDGALSFQTAEDAKDVNEDRLKSEVSAVDNKATDVEIELLSLPDEDMADRVKANIAASQEARASRVESYNKIAKSAIDEAVAYVKNSVTPEDKDQAKKMLDKLVVELDDTKLKGIDDLKAYADSKTAEQDSSIKARIARMAPVATVSGLLNRAKTRIEKMSPKQKLAAAAVGVIALGGSILIANQDSDFSEKIADAKAQVAEENDQQNSDEEASAPQELEITTTSTSSPVETAPEAEETTTLDVTAERPSIEDTLQDTYNLSDAQATRAYEAIKGDIANAPGTYLGPNGDVRISSPGEFQLDAIATNHLLQFLQTLESEEDEA